MLLPNEKLFDEFWTFAFERQNVFVNKFIGKKPYTENPILKEFKFCNAYRVLDRVSQFLLSSVIQRKNNKSEDAIFRIVLFKIFNLPSTWQALEKEFGEISLSKFDRTKFSKFLTKLSLIQPLYNSAYISCANKVFGFERKHDNHLALLEKMFVEDKLAIKIMKAKRMKEAFEILVAYTLIGNFMAYQLVTDINYSNAVDWEESEFTIVGPGSKRGIKKVFNQFDSFEEAIFFAFNNQKKYFEKLGLDFKYIQNRILQPIDIQNLFCEFDKYCRVAHPELKSNRVKIKIKFVETSLRIDYVLPLKWNAVMTF